MSTTDAKKRVQILPEKLASFQNQQQQQDTNPSYTVRVICCVLFIFLTEICLSHYVYRLINSEIRAEYIPKQDFRQFFGNEIRSDAGREEIARILRDELRNTDLSAAAANARGKWPKKKAATATTANSEEGDEREPPGGEDASERPRREKRSAANILDYNLINSPGDEPHVEFFNPKLKSELENRDEIVRQQTGNKGAAPGGDSWVWLTSYSRIPEKALEGYCKKMHQFCPPGRPGPLGPPGTPGQKGERGDTGFPGIPGAMGPRGHPGHSGEKGTQGQPGLDGRDGVPGEPGFDGLPGRNGHDGLPGMDGMPGRPGLNGTDGRPGATGPQGPLGPMGPRGLTGPRGRPGKPGNHGTPGRPGINAWKVNGSSELLIPPSIAGSQTSPTNGPYILREGENVRLHCSATGVPKPHITWKRVDNRPINMGSWEDIQISSHTLNITRINRVHMGVYLCIANNGIPPETNRSFVLEVHFAPLIRIRNPMVGAANGTTAVLECEVEAFPETVRYWKRSDGRLLENGDKYRIDNSYERDGYKVRMQLNITRLNVFDYTEYICVAKNEMNKIEGKFTIYEIDPRLVTPPAIVDEGKGFYFGSPQPDKVSYEDLCGPPVHCPECPVHKEITCPAESGFSLIGLITRWEIRQYGEKTYPGFPNRTLDCQLYAVGKPVYLRVTNEIYGCWMRDLHPLNPKAAEKYWDTKENKEYQHQLFEYDNKTMFRNYKPSKLYNLDLAFQGNKHVIYKGAFYYNKRGSATIIQFDLQNETCKNLTIGNNVTLVPLYSDGHSYMDFNVDDNGLWVIFGVPDANNTAVMKVDSDTMSIQYIWNISIDHRLVGEMFIVCGVLYAVDSVTDRNTKIRFALDLYTNRLVEVSLSFTNPFTRTTMIGYNPKPMELYTWDRGNQLTYPVRYHEMSYASNYTRDRKRDNDHLYT